jgi:hypothetical protein
MVTMYKSRCHPLGATSSHELPHQERNLVHSGVHGHPHQTHETSSSVTPTQVDLFLSLLFRIFKNTIIQS